MEVGKSQASSAEEVRNSGPRGQEKSGSMTAPAHLQTICGTCMRHRTLVENYCSSPLEQQRSENEFCFSLKNFPGCVLLFPLLCHMFAQGTGRKTGRNSLITPTPLTAVPQAQSCGSLWEFPFPVLLSMQPHVRPSG